jgi:hypothetical protein
LTESGNFGEVRMEVHDEGKVLYFAFFSVLAPSAFETNWITLSVS